MLRLAKAAFDIENLRDFIDRDKKVGGLGGLWRFGGFWRLAEFHGFRGFGGLRWLRGFRGFPEGDGAK